MSCERAVEENSRVVVEFPTSWRDRRTACCESWRDRRRACCESWRARRRACCDSWRARCWLACAIFSVLCIVLIFSSPVWLVVVVSVLGNCQRSPTLSLEDVNIHNMVVYQNTTDSPYQVRSEFSVNLTARNGNTVTKCFSTFLRMSVSVEYQGQQIVQQEVPLGFGLKPKERRTIMLDLRGDGYPLKKDSALSLDVVLRNSNGTDFVFTFKSRVMRNDRKARWLTTRCVTIDKTPPYGNFSQANSTGGLARSSCIMYS